MIGAIEIDLAAIAHNARLLRDLVGARHAAFVVKSNAYGHGLVETALALEPFANRLCTYGLDEAIALREGGITGRILVLGPVEPDRLDDAIANKAELALWSTGAFVRHLAAAARKHHVRAGAHVKVDTGLHRLGLEPDDLPDAIEDLLHVGEIELTGLFSHLSSAEELDSPATLHQLDVFERACAATQPLLERARVVPLRHIAASAAAILWPQTRLDLTRFGIATYGLWPSKATHEAAGDGLDLRPALSYRSQIVVERRVAAGAPIGYGASFHAPREMRIGVVPAGYADGIPRALSNRGAFAAGGALCPIVGRIAMNVTEIDLTHAPEAHAGSPVTLIGTDGTARVSADDWAGWADTIAYEIVARLPGEIRRVYREPMAAIASRSESVPL